MKEYKMIIDGIELEFSKEELDEICIHQASGEIPKYTQEKGLYFEKYTPTQEDIREQRKSELKAELSKLSEDIIQAQAGEVVPNIEERKARFITLHNELRELEGKEPREIKK